MTTQDYNWDSSSEETSSYQSKVKKRLLKRLARNKKVAQSPVECADCHIIFETQRDYDNHLASFGGESSEGATIECPDCGAWPIENMCEYNTHQCEDMKTCNICEQEYPASEDAEHHCVPAKGFCPTCTRFVPTVHDCAPARCPFCGVSALTTEIMQQHIEVEHASELNFDEGSDFESDSNIDLSNTNKKCSLCDEYISDADMWYHLNIEHDKAEINKPIMGQTARASSRKEQPATPTIPYCYQEALPEPENSAEDDSCWSSWEDDSDDDELIRQQTTPKHDSEIDSDEFDISTTVVEDLDSLDDIQVSMDTRSRVLLDDLNNLKTALKKADDSSNLLLVEREGLLAQLQMCEKRIQEVEEDRTSLEEELQAKELEKEKHIQELDRTLVNIQKHVAEESVCSELLAEMSEFPQAVQILLNSRKYYDYDDLVRSHVRKLGAYVTSEVRTSIIIEAKLQKKKELESLFELGEGAYLVPKTEDGLPNLYDSLITDSYMIVDE